MSANSAEDRRNIKLLLRPNARRMAFGIVVTFTTRKPSIATSEFDRDDVQWTFVVRAARLVVDDQTVNRNAVTRPHHVSELAPSL
jgi:hypothetical protein